MNYHNALIAVVPAAGVGKRMQANCPKQYLTIDGKTVLEHTVTKLLTHTAIAQVIVVVSADDSYFAQTPLANMADVVKVIGGKERVDSVLAGLKAIDSTHYPWALVHDAARPCVTHIDIDRLIDCCLKEQLGGILASPVRDTMKRSDHAQQIVNTEPRENLWHALTPQCYPVAQLISAIESAVAQQAEITDEASAIEYAGITSQIVAGRSDNIKITQPDDLAMAAFILAQQKEVVCE